MKAESADKLVKISSVINEIYGDDLHKKRQQSIAFAAMGLLSVNGYIKALKYGAGKG